jgi:PadR family transcriptional regulator PadR
VSRESLGEFEQIVLLAVISLEQAAYVVPIVNAIEERIGRTPSHAAVYVALTRLERKRFVSSRLGQATAQRGGRPKRYFKVLPRALPLLRGSRDALLAMWEGIEVTR